MWILDDLSIGKAQYAIAPLRQKGCADIVARDALP
jgi:hypothetical protein